jgi:hypothetical protein
VYVDRCKHDKERNKRRKESKQRKEVYKERKERFTLYILCVYLGYTMGIHRVYYKYIKGIIIVIGKKRIFSNKKSF